MRVSAGRRLFGTTLGNFRTAGADARAPRSSRPTTGVRVPTALRDDVTGVVGLDTQPLFGSSTPTASGDAAFPHKASAAAPERADDESGYLQRTGTAAGCAAAVAQSGFTPNQYLTAYNYAPLQSAGLQGQGERVALIEIDGFRYSDLRSFSKCFGLATPAINGFGVGLKKPLAPGGESTLDLEVLDAAAPKLKAVDVYESRPSAVDVLHSLTAPLHNPGSKPDVISASLGSCEEATQLHDRQLRAAPRRGRAGAGRGQRHLGAGLQRRRRLVGCLTPDGRPLRGPGGELSGVVAVRHRRRRHERLARTPPTRSSAEEVWNDAPLDARLRRRRLQRAVQPARATRMASSSRAHRGVPDVSMLADVAPGYEIYCTAKGDCIGKGTPARGSQVGGTSAAAPLVAGGLALVDQALRSATARTSGSPTRCCTRSTARPPAAGVICDIVANDNDLGPEPHRRGRWAAAPPAPASTRRRAWAASTWPAWPSLAGSVVPPIVNVGVSLPSQRHPVASKHLLAKVSCSGRCLMGAYARIRIGRSRKVDHQVLERSSCSRTAATRRSRSDLTARP